MKVMLDLDGVLVDFRRGVCEAFGRDDPSDSWTFWENWEGVTFKDVNDCCNESFWANLKWTHEGIDIFKAVFEKYTNDIYLLTTPMPNLGSWTGKAQWVNKYIPVFNKRLIVTPVPKKLFADPDTLLIDDKDESIAEFVAAGGHGILVPRPWNELRGWSGETLQVVKNSLEAL